MNNNYIEKYGTIKGVKNEKTIYTKTFKDVQVLVTKQKTDSNGEDYFNVYFIDPIFNTAPMNNLNEQIPVENKPKDWNKYFTIRMIEYIAWRDFNIEGYFTEI